MKNQKTVSVILTASMLMSLCACQDKSMDEVLDLTEDVAKYTCDLDYKKLSKLTEDGDEDLEEIFEGIGDDGFREVIASTLEYEIDEDSLEKDGKKGYTVDVTFTYADYEEVLEDEDIFSYEDFEDAVEDCDEVVEETITLEFEKDGSDILFTNISDLADLFPYWDEEFTFGVTGGVEEADAEEDEDNIDVAPVETDPTPTPTPAATPTPAGTWDNTDYPDPAVYFQPGECLLLHDTNILVTYPDNNTVYGDESLDPRDGYVAVCGGDDDNISSNFYITEVDGSCTADWVLELRDDLVESSATTSWEYESHTTETLVLTVGDLSYEGVLATVTATDGDVSYIYYVMIGTDHIAYSVCIMSDDIEYIYGFMGSFSYVT